MILGDKGTSLETAPAIGTCLADWITLGQPRTMDPQPSHSPWFAHGRLMSA